MFRSSLTIAALVAVFLPGSAYGVALQILDCNGVTRAMSDVEAASKNQVKINTFNPAGGQVTNTPVTLTNTQTGQVITANVTNGSATFEGVSNGAWVVESAGQPLAISAVSVESTVSVAAATAAAGGVTVVGGGAAVGTTEVVTTVVDQVAGNNTPSDSSDSGGSSGGDGSGSGNDGSGDGTDIPGAEDPGSLDNEDPCEDCNPDEDVDPIDHFFPDDPNLSPSS